MMLTVAGARAQIDVCFLLLTTDSGKVEVFEEMTGNGFSEKKREAISRFIRWVWGRDRKQNGRKFKSVMEG